MVESGLLFSIALSIVITLPRLKNNFAIADNIVITLSTIVAVIGVPFFFLKAKRKGKLIAIASRTITIKK